MSIINDFTLKNKVAVVTGGYGHLGKATTKALCEAKAKVIVAGKSKEKFEKALNREQDICFVEMDISSTNSIKQALKEMNDKFFHIDILINNAVYVKSEPAETMNDETWNAGVDGVLNSTFRCIREVLPYMKSTGGSIINISSMYGVVSPDFRIYKNHEKFTNPPQYGAAKAGVMQLTRYFAILLAEYAIRVNCISPGSFPSKEVQKDKDFIDNLKNKVPLGRIGTPEDLKGSIVFLASKASSYITGQNLIVDGGWTIW